MKIETLRKSHKKKIIIGVVIVLLVISTITLTMSKSKYSKETINYKELDKRTIAVNISEDGTNYNIVDDIPINGYKLNEEKSVCKVQTETSGVENAPIDRSISIEYIDGKVNFLGIGKRATRCYLYFDKKDEEIPIITNVIRNVTESSITINVEATDNVGVTEYWYAIDSDNYVREGNSKTYTGLGIGSTHTIKIYVKDEAGNQSETRVETIQTTPDTTKPVIAEVSTSVTKTEITVVVSAHDNNGAVKTGVTEYYYQIDSGTVIRKTTNSHVFTGLSAGSSHSIKVYVKDGAGNQSDTVTRSVTTTKPTSETTLAKLNINPSYIKEGNPNFAAIATGAETVADNGIYKMADPMYKGETYYWRGAATSNHVIFANKCWRIIRINGDGTIRIIYNGVPSGTAPNQTCPGNGSNSGSIAVTSQAYNASYNNSAYVGYTHTAGVQRPTPTTGGTASNLKTQTETWFNNNSNFTDAQRAQVAEGKYCNDRTIGSGTWSATGGTFYYAARERLQTNKTPTLACEEEDVYTLKAGAITADEVSMAGGVYGTNNTSYYLYNGQYYWTMSPYYWGSGRASVFSVFNDGRLDYTAYVISTFGVRPVINLKSNTEFATGGDGTTSKPYVVQ